MGACIFQSMSDPSQVEDPAKDQQYSEAAVDNMRIQKDEVLLCLICRISFKYLYILLSHNNVFLIDVLLLRCMAFIPFSFLFI